MDSWYPVYHVYTRCNPSEEFMPSGVVRDLGGACWNFVRFGDANMRIPNEIRWERLIDDEHIESSGTLNRRDMRALAREYRAKCMRGA